MEKSRMAAKRLKPGAAMRSTLGMGLLCGAAGLLIGLFVAWQARGSGYGWFPLASGLSAALAGAGLWWLLLARRDLYRPHRGWIAGALAGLFSHYLCWLFLFLGSNLCFWLFGGCRSSLGEPPAAPPEAIWGAAVFSLGSLFFFGWVTVPLGALIGGLLAWRFQAVMNTFEGT